MMIAEGRVLWMEVDYSQIGQRIAARRRELGLKQSQVEERAELSYKYLSNIERGISIPSTEVIMRLALVLDTTPDAFLVGTGEVPGEPWRTVAQQLRPLSLGQLKLVSELIEVIGRQRNI